MRDGAGKYQRESGGVTRVADMTAVGKGTVIKSQIAWSYEWVIIAIGDLQSSS